MTLTPEVAAATIDAIRAELAWRQAAERLELGPPDPRIARRHLLEFIRWGFPRYEVGWFHRELCGHLEWFSRAVALRQSPRLIIAAPPRHGKSEIVSRRWPVWHLGQHPDHEVVVASYGQEFANRMSRDARGVRARVVESWPEWGHLEPKPGGTDGVELWQVAGGGSYQAVGAGGPLNGAGAHALAIDDPFKNAEEAESEVIRQARWDWYTSTAYTRLAPGGGILIMATRWHDDDMSGRALEQLRLGEEDWRVVRYPAIAEEDEPFRKAGEALHPARYDLADLQRKRLVMGSRQFAALYQQSPQPASGGMFQREWMRHRYHHDPQRPPRPGYYTEIVVTVDTTFKDGEGTDRVSMQAWGRIDWTEYHLLDDLTERMSYVACRQALRDFAAKWKPGAILIEEKGNGHALISDLHSELPAVIGFLPDPHGNKKSRASVATPLWEAGCVKLPAGPPWVGDYVEEFAAFPLGTHDDRVDAMSQLFLWWAERRGGFDREALLDAVEGVLGGAGAEPEGLLDW